MDRHTQRNLHTSFNIHNLCHQNQNYHSTIKKIKLCGKDLDVIVAYGRHTQTHHKNTVGLDICMKYFNLQ